MVLTQYPTPNSKDLFRVTQSRKANGILHVFMRLIEKGIVKAKKLKNNPEKIRWQYVLTPTGVKEKIKITQQYLQRRMVEFEEIQKEIASLKREIHHKE